LQPFKAAVDGGVMTMMSSFSELNGVPATANEFLLRQILRDEWSFDGMVVSDWDSVRQLSVHGLTENDKESAFEATSAGIDMEMAGDSYNRFLAELVDEGRVGIEMIDAAVANILLAKCRLGLFESPLVDASQLPKLANDDHLATAKELALQSIVMLKNDKDVLPLSVARMKSIAVVGPLADAPYEQLGTWIFDGDANLSVSGVDGLRELVGDAVDVRFVQGMETSRSRDTGCFEDAVEVARGADAVVLFLGEEAILSGEAHCRADISLPGAQAELVRRIRATGRPVIAVVLAGRPLTLTDIVDEVDALLFAWHPGTMGGAAIADLLFGLRSPVGKLPATFPRMVGQIPIYYNQKNTGKPPKPDQIVHIDEIDARAPQVSLGMSAFHLDAGYKPLFPFGYGLSYAKFDYQNIRTSAAEVSIGNTLTISADLTNHGTISADEVVQLYVRDLVGSVTRPVRELKGFRRVRVEPGETVVVDFDLHTDELAFYGRDNTLTIEAGNFHVWIGGSSDAALRGEFRVIAAH
jgi:beta-glucosidase